MLRDPGLKASEDGVDRVVKRSELADRHVLGSHGPRLAEGEGVITPDPSDVVHGISVGWNCSGRRQFGLDSNHEVSLSQ